MNKKIDLLISIENEMKNSYLEYSTNVIINRSIPDVRDGLKTVHRRIIYSMYELKNFWNNNYKKSARIVGDVIGKYHPHGDLSVYEAIIKLCQKFSMRYNLIEGQGNFGSLDGDSAAAMRYTEVKLSKIGFELLRNINDNTVKFVKNYDGTLKQPEIFPSNIPNILINGSHGIAVGMSTNIPSHNLNEVINACIYVLENKNCKIRNIQKIIKSPDFISGGVIDKSNKDKILNIYKKGKGVFNIRAKIHIEENNYGKELSVIITQFPYLINKNKFLNNLNKLIEKKFFYEIKNIKDESNKKGYRIILLLKKNINIKIFIKKLYENTVLEYPFYVNMLVLVKNKPRLLNLKKIINYYLKHRKKIILNKNINDLKKLKLKYVELEGKLIALNNINKFIYIIKSSDSNLNLKKKIKKLKWKTKKFKILFNKINKLNFKILKKNYFLNNFFFFKKKKYYKLSFFQINKILNIKLNNINLKKKKNIEIKYINVLKKIIKIFKILYNKKKIKKLIKNELINIKKKFSDKRLTKINF